MVSLIKLNSDRKQIEETPLALLEYQSPTASFLASPVTPVAGNVIWVTAAVVAVMILLSVTIPTEIVSEGYGQIVSGANIDIIQPLETSIVRKINVKPGDRVIKGEVVAELDPTFSQSDLGSLEAQYDSAQTDVERYQAELSEQPYVPSRHNSYTDTSLNAYKQDIAQFNSTTASYDARVKGLQSQLDGAQTDLFEYQKEAGIADQVLAKRQELFRLNVGSQLDLLSAQSQGAELHRQVESTQSSIAAAKHDLASMVAERDAYKQSFFSQQAQSLASRKATLDDATAQLTKQRLVRQLVELKADQDGSVLTVASVAPGSVMQSGDQLITVQPDSAENFAQVDIPAEMSGYLRVGDPVTLKFSAFNYTTHGVALGTLISVTAGSFLPSQQQQSAATQGVNSGPAAPKSGQTGLPSTDVVSGLFYRAMVRIDKVDMHAVPADFKPEPGMAVTADVLVGKRTTFDQIVERVMPSLAEYGRSP